MGSFLMATVILMVSITLHEMLHAWVAYSLRMTVSAIFIGPPTKWSKRFVYHDKEREKEIEILVSPFPFLGGVKIEDNSYWYSPWWKKALVSVYGPVANALTGILVAVFALGAKDGISVSREMFFASWGAIKYIAALIKGGDSLGAASLISGPIEIVTISTRIIEIDFWLGTVFVVLLLNFGIAVINMIPIPGLDGGFIVLGAVCSLFGNSTKVVKVAKFLTLVFSAVLVLGLLALTITEIVEVLRSFLCEGIPGVC